MAIKASMSEVDLKNDNVVKVKIEVDTSELDVAIEKMERLVVLKNEYEAITTELNIDGNSIAKGVKKYMGDNL